MQAKYSPRCSHSLTLSCNYRPGDDVSIGGMNGSRLPDALSPHTCVKSSAEYELALILKEIRFITDQVRIATNFIDYGPGLILISLLAASEGWRGERDSPGLEVRRDGRRSVVPYNFHVFYDSRHNSCFVFCATYYCLVAIWERLLLLVFAENQFVIYKISVKTSLRKLRTH